MPATDLETQIVEIQTALLNRSDELGVIVADTVWREVDYYADTGQISRDDLIANCIESLRLIFDVLDAAATFDTALAARTGVARARAGIPLPEIMDAYRIGCRLTWEEIVTLAATRPHISREALIRASARIWLAQDVYTHAMASAYRETMTNRVLTQAAEQAALVEALIDGRIVEQANLWEIAAMLRLPARGPYVVVAAECASLGRSALPGIEAKLSDVGIASAWRLLPDVQLGLAHVGSDAQFETLKQTLTRIAATPIGVSSRFDDLSQTPQGVTYARIALSAKRSDSSLLSVFEAEPLAVAAVSAPPRVMKQISNTVFAGFADLEERDRETLFTTFRMWLNVDGSITDAADRLYCHPNTVRHRLRRIEERTGRSLSRPRDLAELCLAFEIDLRLP
ncbi:MAG: PucR family transcriptional regulator [Mycolicibacterium sp.]|uniref:PucR family transcriptional regulator n=1 Tax=Mycolicibacterium sp. TaxID=2320850 RepID=UPI003D0B29B8